MPKLITTTILVSELIALRKDSARLKWLHTGGRSGARREWGVAEIEFDANGRVIGALWGASDSSDIDKAMDEEASSEGLDSRVDQSQPDPLMDPIGWRKWWMKTNPGKSWEDSDRPWGNLVLGKSK